MGVQITARELLRPWQIKAVHCYDEYFNIGHINAVHCYDEYFNIVLVYNFQMPPCFIVYLGM